MLSSLFRYAPVQVFSALSIFLLIAIQTRFLSLEEYGLLAVFMLVVELLRACSSQWINTSMLRLYHSATDAEKNRLSVTGLRLIYGCLFPAASLLMLGLFAYGRLSTVVFFALTGILIVKGLYLYFLELARLTERLTIYRSAVITQSVMAICISLLLLSIKATVEVAIAALACSYIVAGFWVINQPFKQGFDIKLAKRLCSYGVPILIASFISILTSRVDRLFIVENLGLSETGAYAAISNMLMGVMGLIFMVVAMPLYPDLTKVADKPDLLKKAHANYFDILLAIALPALIGLCFTAEPLVRIFLTEQYLMFGVELFWILAASTFLLNLKAHYVNHGLQFLLKTRFMPWVAAGGLICNIALLVLLIKPLGIYGAAWGTLVANFIALIISGGVAIKLGYRYSMGANGLKVIVSCLLMALALSVVSPLVKSMDDMAKLIFLIVVGFMTYCLSAVIQNSFNSRTWLKECVLNER